MKPEGIVNKVANSSLVNFNLEDYYTEGKRVAFDIAPFLWQELVIKEKDFRKQVKAYNWKAFEGDLIAIHCSSNAIIPTWAYMLIALSLEPFASKVCFGSLQDLERELLLEKLSPIDFSSYSNKKVIIRGCSNKPIPEFAYTYVALKLKPFAQSIMFGEACSSVPLFKQKKNDL